MNWTELFSHGRLSARVLRSRENLWEVVTLSTKPGRKMRKNGIWLNVFPFEKICHSNIKWKPGSVIVPLTWLNLKWPLSNRVCGHGTGSCSCLQCVFAALLMWISSDCCCVEKYQTCCSLQGKLSCQSRARNRNIDLAKIAVIINAKLVIKDLSKWSVLRRECLNRLKPTCAWRGFCRVLGPCSPSSPVHSLTLS